MGHDLLNLTGIPDDVVQKSDEKVRRLLPGSLTMGHTGTGGMFTILKAREDLRTYHDPGWYEMPPATQAHQATAAEFKVDDIAVPPAPTWPRRRRVRSTA